MNTQINNKSYNIPVFLIIWILLAIAILTKCIFSPFPAWAAFIFGAIIYRHLSQELIDFRKNDKH